MLRYKLPRRLWDRGNYLNGNMIKELEQFFVSYNKPEGKKFKVLGCKNADVAMKLIKDSRKAA
jgi:inorganic pyrophosphatase